MVSTDIDAARLFARLNPKLTSSERIVLIALLSDFTQSEIADRLSISRAAVCQAVRKIRMKAIELLPEVCS